MAALTQLSEDELLFRDAVRKFAGDEIVPLVRKMDESSVLDKGLLKRLFELGLMGIEIPEEYGGQGGSFFDCVLAIEEISAADPGVGVVMDVQNTIVNNAILRWGTESQKRQYLPGLASGTVGAYALSEAGSGSDAFALATTAHEEGGDYVLNGRKLWISNAAEAGLFVLFASLDLAAGYRGITAFLVERGFAGFSVGHKEDKVGIRASSTCELILDNCRVPKQNVLGEKGKGYKIAIETLNEGRIGIGAQMLGLARASLHHAVGYSKERKQFGQAIAGFQAVQFDLAKMATDLEAARLLVWNAARLRDARQSFVQEAAMAKYFSSEAAERIASKAVEIHGGVGVTKEYPVEKLWRDSKVGRIYEGTSNIQLQTIARKLLT
jgi:butyryl-CoA dehydrogenase/short/branched chain acyl-CoA dehydrogenase